MGGKLLVFGLAFVVPLAAGADECAARADAVVAQLERDARTPLSPSEVGLARQAAFASCAGPTPDAPREAAAEPASSGLERMLAGLLSMEPRPARKRLGGKYRYLEKD